MAQLLVCSDEQLVATLFGSVQQLPVSEVEPPHLKGCIDRMLLQETTEWSGSSLI